MKLTTKLSFITLSAIACGATNAQVVDGTVDGSYGNSLCVQNVQTQFGDSNLGLPGYANGSELNSIYAKVVGTDLYICIPGNVESNYNHLYLIIDSVPGGQNRLLQNQTSFSFQALQRIADDGSGNGLTFDSGFEADYFFNFSGGDNGGTYAGYFDYLIVGDSNSGVYLGSCGAQNGTLTGGNDLGVLATIDNSNVLGVGGGTGAACGKGVTTGFETKIPLALLGNPTGPIKICAVINGSGNDYFSNQFLGGIGPSSNLGEPRNVNLALIAGSQYVVAGTNSITGSITYSDLDASVVKECANITLSNGVTEYTQTVELDENGSYSIAAPSNGEWLVTVQESPWLRRSVVANTSAGNASGIDLVLVNGDADGDNEVTLVDFGIISAAFGSVDGDPNWDARADLNFDGEVNLFDVGIVAANFGQAGDE